ncbi:MAG: hypothetical protein H3C71_08645, partial [Flavobacteriales bacterium]|nr:hypothetical protein [Flavobacteriales bacterium]
NKKIFTSIDFLTLKARLYQLYKWKGFPEETIERRWHERLVTEYRLIDNSRTHADLII